MSLPKHYTVAEVAGLLNVSHKTIRAIILRGELPAVKVGGAIRVSESDLSSYLEQQKIQPPVQKPAAARRVRFTGKNHFA